MKASELIAQLQELVDANGDHDVAIDCYLRLHPVKDVDMSAEEDDCFVIWVIE